MVPQGLTHFHLVFHDPLQACFLIRLCTHLVIPLACRLHLLWLLWARCVHRRSQNKLWVQRLAAPRLYGQDLEVYLLESPQMLRVGHPGVEFSMKLLDEGSMQLGWQLVQRKTNCPVVHLLVLHWLLQRVAGAWDLFPIHLPRPMARLMV